MFNRNELTKFENHMRRVTLAAGEKVASGFESKNFRLSLKEDLSPLTDIDIKSQQLIIKLLKEQFPQAEYIAEEATRPDGLEKLSDRMFFLIDPLDGTSNFSLSIPIFSISMALWYGGELLVGCLLDPIHGEYFHAFKGGGAYLNDKPIHPAPYVSLRESFVDINVAKLDEQMMDRIMNRIGRNTKKVRCMGCVSLEVTWAAVGRIHGVVNHYLSIWDIAAAGLILEEAGGKWTTLSNEKPRFPYTGKFPICAAGTNRLHSKLIELVNED